MLDKKKIILTSIVLGSIAACSGVLIGVTNLITKDRIAINEQNKINEGMKAIFEQNSVKIEELSLEEAGITGEYKYVETFYLVKDENGEELGCAIRTSGSNMYGKISLIAGFDKEDQSFISLSLITNEQTYATTLVDNYINPLNDGDRILDDVSCGATYGAKLVRDMVNEGQEAALEYFN